MQRLLSANVIPSDLADSVHPRPAIPALSLTFLTPTLLAGDRSLVDVVAHELSHSWFGNNVVRPKRFLHLLTIG